MQGNARHREAGRHGVSSIKDFLDNREAQEVANNLYLKHNERYLRREMLDVVGPHGRTEKVSVWALAERHQTYVGRHGNTITLTPAGVAAAAHRSGVGAVGDYVTWLARNNWDIHDKIWQSAYGPIAQRLQDAQELPYESRYAP